MKTVKIMNQIGRYALFILAVFFISGCEKTQVSTYRYSPPTTIDGMACVDECKQSRRTCSNLCTMPDQQCLAQAQAKANYEYQQYVNEQTVAGQPISRTPASFYDEKQCKHAGCGCESEFEVCYQLCGTRTELKGPTAKE